MYEDSYCAPPVISQILAGKFKVIKEMCYNVNLSRY